MRTTIVEGAELARCFGEENRLVANTLSSQLAIAEFGSGNRPITKPPPKLL